MKRKTARNKADKLWSQIIRSKKYCEVCGEPGTNPHHVVGRKNLTLRHDPKNGVLLCFQHHTGNRTSAHSDPIWFLQWFKTNRKKDYNYIMIKKQELSTKIDYEEVIDFLKTKIENEKKA